MVNHANYPLTHVVLQDLLPPGFQHLQGAKLEADVGTIAPGETKIFPLEVVATRAGSMTNEVTACADGGRKAQSRTTVEVTDSTLIVKIDALDRAAASQDTDVRLEVVNRGPTPAANVRLTQMVPDGFDVLGTSEGGTFDAPTRSVAWSLGSLQPGEPRSVTLKARSRLVGVWKWTALLNADGMSDTRTEHTTTVENEPRPTGSAP